jgi:dTDP-4-amino-4,6-dideoxygalactose transaminase
LRFPIAVADPTALTQYLDRCGIHIGDRWYRSAVDSGKLAYASKYKTGSCPNAEHLSARCVNLPTHQFITEADAEYIAECIKKHLK